jgi:hypothetical protein
MKKLLLMFMFSSIFLLGYSPNINNQFTVVYDMCEIKVEFLMKTIAIKETGNRNMLGGSGEFSKYQIMPSTWKYWSKKYFGVILEDNEENHDKIVKAVLTDLVKKYNTEQIAAIWNCGSVYYKNRIGVNKYGIPYNTPQYVKEFLIIHQDLIDSYNEYLERLFSFSTN